MKQFVSQAIVVLCLLYNKLVTINWFNEILSLLVLLLLEKLV